MENLNYNKNKNLSSLKQTYALLHKFQSQEEVVGYYLSLHLYNLDVFSCAWPCIESELLLTLKSEWSHM